MQTTRFDPDNMRHLNIEEPIPSINLPPPPRTFQPRLPWSCIQSLRVDTQRRSCRIMCFILIRLSRGITNIKFLTTQV